MISGQKILVTGGAGFIGSNLAEKLLELGKHVVVLDNFSTGKRENLSSMMNHPAFTLIEGDIRNPDDCAKAVKGAGYVFHEAALGSVPRSVKDPGTSTEVNISGFVNMLYAAKEAKVKRFVYASSSSVYGDNPTMPKVEENIGKPLSPYAVTKQVNELFAENFHSLYGIDTIGLRYFNVFGRRQDPCGAYAAVIPKFVISLLNHESPVINGDGSFSRDFTYIDNVIQANMLALNVSDEKALNQAYNIAFGGRTTLNELFGYLKQELSVFDPEIVKIQPVYGSERDGDIPHSLACIGKARNLLGYSPEFDVKTGLKSASEWYFNNYGKKL